MEQSIVSRLTWFKCFHEISDDKIFQRKKLLSCFDKVEESC